MRALAAVTLALIAATPATTHAQKVDRVGLLLQTTPSAASHIVAAFTQGLRELGHVEGRNLVIESRWAEGQPDRFLQLADELVRLRVNVIVASATPAAEAARRATGSIPIVMVNVSDPVEAGLVQSLGRPGGNVTGLSAQITTDVRAKQLQLLKEALPGLGRVAILRRAAVADAALWREYEAAGQTLGVKVQFADVKDIADLERAFGALARERPGAVLVPGDPVFFTNRRRIVGLLGEHRLPAMFYAREFTELGGLMSYSARLTDQFRRAAVYADKILRGASPATLPVESPAGFELVVNLRAAQTLKLTLPQATLVRADDVIK